MEKACMFQALWALEAIEIFSITEELVHFKGMQKCGLLYRIGGGNR
jgi:hypothetical protein